MKKLLLFCLVTLLLLVQTSVAYSRERSANVTSSSIVTNGLSWGLTADTGPYTLAPGLTNYVVDTPDGQTPTLSDLRSLRYHHHTRIAVDAGGRVWVAYSGCLTGEDQSGEITEVNSSADNWKTSTGPIVVIAPPSHFDTTLSSGRRISYPRAFVTYKSQLYLVSAIDEKTSSGSTNEIGLALVATVLNRDGTVGRSFRVSSADYTPLSGYPSYEYDTQLAPYIYQQANLFGVWGGSAPGQTPSAWTGYITSGGATFVEPSTASILHSHSTLLRLWRAVSGTDKTWLYSSQSSDDGQTWSAPIRTNIPNAPSATAMIRLADGRIALVGNPQNEVGGVPRDPLYLALFDGTTGVVQSVYAVRQGLSGKPAYSNGQSGGAQYPGIWQHGKTLWISYSIAKQDIDVTSILEPAYLIMPHPTRCTSFGRYEACQE